MAPPPDSLAPDPLPRVSGYLSRLPAGALSYPECQARADLLRRSLAERPLQRHHVAALPAPVARVVTCPPLEGEWVPDVWLACVLLAIADAHGLDDAGYLDWLRGLNLRMLSGPYRQVVTAPPERLLLDVPDRWGVFHRGTTLGLREASPGRCSFELAFPPRLFHGLTLRQFEPVLEVALQAATPGGRVTLLRSEDERGVFEATWAHGAARPG